MSTEHIDKAFRRKKEEGWDKLYWLVDMHDTMIKSNYDASSNWGDLYPYCASVLNHLTKRKDMVLVLWTSSFPDYIEKFCAFLKDVHGIEFDYVNENPECENTETGRFNDKYYFNIIIDDKAGFSPKNGWRKIWYKLKNIEKEGKGC